MPDKPYHQRAESWGRKAEDYESLFVPLSARAAQAAVELLDVRPGMAFLDVATGTGAVALAAARRGARVTAIDFAPGMLEVLRDKLAREAIDNVELRQMDGQSLAFDAEEFDAAGSGFGLVFFPDLAKGLDEMLRVLKTGGRAFVSTTGHPGSSQLAALIGEAMGRVLGGDSGRSPTGASIAIGSSAQLRALLDAAGFVDTRVEACRVAWPVSDPGTFWDRWVIESPPSATAMSQLPPAIRTAGRAEFVALVERAGVSEFSTEVLIGLGTRP